MATIPWLIDVLRAEGCQVVEEGDWRSRAATGSFAPIGVLWHHTAAVSSADNPAPSLDVVIGGRPDLSGPLCHALIDFDGVFHLVAAGRANHAGESGGSGPIPAGDGNTLLVGWEIDYQGVDQAMTGAQYDAAVRGTAAVLRRLGKDASYARGHRETSTTGKIDPGLIDLDRMRRDVAAQLSGGPSAPVPRIDIAVLTPSNTINHRYYRRGAGWSGWEDLGGPAGSSPALASWGDGRLDLAALNPGNRINYRSYARGSGWSGWQDLGGPAKGAPALSTWGNGRLDLFALTPANTVNHRWFVSGSGWSGWEDLGGPALSPPAATSWGDGRIDLVALSPANTINHRWYERGKGWSGWQSIGGPAIGTPAITSWGPGRLDVVALTPAGLVNHRWFDAAGGWSPWEGLGGPVTGSPAVSSWGVGRLDVFAVNGQSRLVHRYYDRSAGWSAWEDLGGPAKGSPAAVSP
ncbi:N-acetylmuramoyl-L-alanine amidase [Micromonospora sp. 067-2]|uniref:N-acetylmuramoyl-L-alanine amidase n=1 Tax=Micromonospora sp. 067-2 TaxID=2789270 RepID=UPI00397CD6B6